VGIKSLTANAGNYVAVSAEKFLRLIGKAWARVNESAADAGFLIYDPELPMPFTDDLGPVFDEEQELTNEGILEMKGLVYNPWSYEVVEDEEEMS